MVSLACLVVLAGTAAGLATSASPDADRLKDKNCARQNAELTRVANADVQDYLAYSRVLRQRILENPGPQHRAFSRRALIKLLLLRSKQAVVGTEECLIGAEPLTAVEYTRIDQWFVLVDKGASAAANLHAALRSSDASDRVVRTLVAAQALSLTGAVPTQAMTDDLNAMLAAEKDATVRLELALALAAYAQRNKDAFVVFREFLLAESDCAFAEAVAFLLPGEDLRYRLFHGLIKDKTARGRNIREWVRETRYSGCRRD